MWRYQKPTDKEAKKAKALLKAKLSDYLTDQNIVPIDEKFNVEETLEKLSEACYKNTEIRLEDTFVSITTAMKFPLTCPPLGIYYNKYGNVINNKQRETLMRTYDIPNHKVYVETQWRYVLELIVCHKESMRLFNEGMLYSIQVDQCQDPNEFDDEPYCTEFISDLARFCFGARLTNPFTFRPPHIDPFPYYRYDWVPMLKIRGLPQFGNIIAIDSGPRVVERYLFELLQSIDYEMSIDITKRHSQIDWGDPKEYLTQHIAHQVMCRCKLGLFTVETWCVFTTIVNVSDKSLKVKFDVTMVADSFNEATPIMYPPVALMIAKIAEIHQTNPRDYRQETERTLTLAGDWAQGTYLDFYYNEEVNDGLFVSLKEKFPKLHHDGWITEPDFEIIDLPDSAIVVLEKGALDSYAREIPDELVAIKVLDNAKNLKLPYKSSFEKTVDVLVSKYNRYQDFVMSVDNYNERHACKINTIPRIFGNYLSFLADEEPDNYENYITCGLSVIMPFLTQKPESREDFLKGLEQLIIMNRGGLANFHVKLESMFIYNGKFVFTSSCISDDLLKERKLPLGKFPLTKQVNSFTTCWRSEDPEITEEYVWERVGEIQCKVNRLEPR